MGMLAGVTDCRRSRKWGCKGRWALGFKPRHGSSEGEENHTVLRGNEEDHVALGCFFLLHVLGSRRDFARKKTGERTLAAGP